jgi:aspartate/tyrosine/aromatic aminotransferase
VKKAEAIINEQTQSGAINHEYLPIGGLAEMVSGGVDFAFGKDHAAIAEGRVCHTLSLATCRCSTGMMERGARESERGGGEMGV